MFGVRLITFNFWFFGFKKGAEERKNSLITFWLTFFAKFCCKNMGTLKQLYKLKNCLETL